MRFNLQLMQKRANYTEKMRKFAPKRTHQIALIKHSDALINKWAVIIVKIANVQGFKLNISNGRAMARYAISARANGMTYAEAVLYAISKYS